MPLKLWIHCFCNEIASSSFCHSWTWWQAVSLITKINHKNSCVRCKKWSHESWDISKGPFSNRHKTNQDLNFEASKTAPTTDDVMCSCLRLRLGRFSRFLIDAQRTLHGDRKGKQILFGQNCKEPGECFVGKVKTSQSGGYVAECATIPTKTWDSGYKSMETSLRESQSPADKLGCLNPDNIIP